MVFSVRARHAVPLPMLLAVFLFTFSACGTTTPGNIPATTPSSDTIPARIHSPKNGAVIYAESISIIGTGAEGESLVIEVVDMDETVIAQATAIVALGGEWAVELVHGYTGDPSEMMIRLATSSGDLFDTATIVIADVSHRPEGVYGRILWPVEGTTLGGDSILVEGIASGIENDQFTVTLNWPEGTVIDSQTVTVYNPNHIDEMPWSAQLRTQGLLGEVAVTAYFTAEGDPNPSIDTVKIELTMNAG